MTPSGRLVAPALTRWNEFLHVASATQRPRVGEVLRRTAAQVWHTTVQLGDHEWIEHGTARGVRAAVARGGIAQRAHPGIRSADCKDGQTDVSGNGVTQTGPIRANVKRNVSPS